MNTKTYTLVNRHTGLYLKKVFTDRVIEAFSARNEQNAIPMSYAGAVAQLGIWNEVAGDLADFDIKQIRGN